MLEKVVYKLHGLEPVLSGAQKITVPGKFYDSLEEARKAAIEYAERPNCKGIVIFQAIEVIEKAPQPLIHYRVDSGSKVY